MNKRLSSYILLSFLQLLLSCRPDGGSQPQGSSKEGITVFIHAHHSTVNLADVDRNSYFIGKNRSRAFFERKLKNISGVNPSEHFCSDRSEKVANAQSYADVDACLKEFSKDRRIDHIVVGPSESLVMMGGHFRSQYSVPGFKKDFVERFVDKHVMKKYLLARDPDILTSQQLYIGPEYKNVSVDKLQKYIEDHFGSHYTKFVIKPTSEAGSRGVEVFEKSPSLYEDMALYLRSADKESAQAGYVLENFVEGTVLRFDGYIAEKSFINFTSSSNVTPLNFYQYGHPLLETLVKDPIAVARYDEYARRILKALDYPKGIFHLEAIEDPEGKLHFLEIAIRVGGGNKRGLTLLGYNPELAYLYTQLNKDITFTPNNKMLVNFTLMTPLFFTNTNQKHKIKAFEFDLKNLETFMSKHSSFFYQVGDSMEAPNRDLFELNFVGDDEETVLKESQSVFDSMKIEVIFRGGLFDKHVFRAFKDGWKSVMENFNEKDS